MREENGRRKQKWLVLHFYSHPKPLSKCEIYWKKFGKTKRDRKERKRKKEERERERKRKKGREESKMGTHEFPEDFGSLTSVQQLTNLFLFSHSLPPFLFLSVSSLFRDLRERERERERGGIEKKKKHFEGRYSEESSYP